MKSIYFILMVCFVGVFTGCAHLTVSKVIPDADPQVFGLRYSLPKPFIQVVPQGDGTVSVSVIYLPDSENTYAIDTTSFMSSYVFQGTLDQNGLLKAVEFKKSTSAVGQQVAATSGAIAAQVLNVHNTQLLAAQTAVNTAQSAVDSAQTNRDAAEANLESLQSSNASESQIRDAKSKLAQEESKLSNAQQVLDRAKNTSRAVQITASAGTPITTTSPTPSTTGFGLPTWTPLPVYNISGKWGAVLFELNDYKDEKGVNKVELKAAKIDKAFQHIFETVNLTPITLGPQGITFTAGGVASFEFSQEVTEITGQRLVTIKPKSEVENAPEAELQGNSRTVEMSLKTLKKGRYELTLNYKYKGGSGQEGYSWSKVTFTVK